VCTDKKKSILARPQIHDLMRKVWQEADHWLVGRYVLMPDHIHLFCVPQESEASDLTNWVKYWKSIASRRWPFREEQPIWQKSFWERQLRSEESYEQKWEYVSLNPQRKGLVRLAEDWPYQGELNPF